MESLGEKLRKRREELVLSIKDIETKTNIRAKYLEAIENGDYDLVPGEVFLKGFIKNYSESLGFNGADLLKQYHDEKNGVLKMPEELATTIDSNQIAKSRELEELINTLNDSIYVNEPEQQLEKNKNAQQNSKTYSYEKTQERKSSSLVKITLLGLVIICVVGLTGYVIFAEPSWFGSNKDKKIADAPAVTNVSPNIPTSSSTTETKVMENKAVETPKVPTMPTTPAKPVEPSKPETRPSEPAIAETSQKIDTKVNDIKKTTSKQAVKVAANITEPCWMTVSVDGREVFTGVAKPGENKNWVANEQVIVHLGNAGGVNLTVNDQVIAKGKQGEVVIRTFNATK